MFEEFKRLAPGRFLNCGVAETNMMSVAAGMALSGLRPVVYTITPFTTVRVLEQLRVDVCYHEAPVVIVGTGSGLSYAELGPTHHSLEDIAITRCLPGLNVLAPADSHELIAFLNEALESPSPTYIRIGKRGEPVLDPEGASPRIGIARTLRDGEDIAILCIGPITSEALRAAEMITADGPRVEVISMGTVKPLDVDFLDALARRCDRWITLEEHGLIGGLGSAVLEWLAGTRHAVQLTRIGVPDAFIHELGDQAFVRSSLGLDAPSIHSAIREAIA
ncbi:uncharacterized protein METZ01_LOCUS136188 [marine metagenome]|uniref:Transketolase-like pyrimidine-binding domain-containing protein n=1 Tax=marine metagenome TaxID=408172 RepID=A0A381Z2F8_9ZZZZ